MSLVNNLMISVNEVIRCMKVYEADSHLSLLGRNNVAILERCG